MAVPEVVLCLLSTGMTVSFFTIRLQGQIHQYLMSEPPAEFNMERKGVTIGFIHCNDPEALEALVPDWGSALAPPRQRIPADTVPIFNMQVIIMGVLFTGTLVREVEVEQVV